MSPSTRHAKHPFSSLLMQVYFYQVSPILCAQETAKGKHELSFIYRLTFCRDSWGWGAQKKLADFGRPTKGRIKIVFTMGTEIKSSFGSASGPFHLNANGVHQELLKEKVVTVMYSRCFGDDNEIFWHIATLEQLFPGIIIIGWLVWLLLSWKRRPSGAFYWWKYF